MHIIDDIELLRRIKSADELAFRCLFDRYHKLMYIEARSILNSDAEAEDSVQEIFIWLWEKKAKIKVDYSLRMYLVRAVKYNCANKIRSRVTEEKRKKLYSEGMEEDFLQLSNIEYKELNQKIAAAINQVAPVSRVAFQKSYLEGKHISEIAQEMGVSIYTVKNNISRAIKSLRKSLGNAH